MYYQPREIPPHQLLLPPLPPPPPPPKVNPSHQLRLPKAYTDPYGRDYARSIFQKYETSKEIMTQKEMNEYHRLVKERDGFDVTPSIKGYGKGILMPVNLDQKKVAHKLKIFSELALMKYCPREQLPTYLQFVKVVKANYEVENGYVYYITFDAKDPSAGNGCISTFQAKVWDAISKIEVQLVRPKPMPNQEYVCFWENSSRQHQMTSRVVPRIDNSHNGASSTHYSVAIPRFFG